MRSSPIFVGAAAVAVFGVFAFQCSLGLDESLIDKKDGGILATIDANLPDGTTVSESGVPEVPNGQPCKVDTDCVAANACLTGRCDQARGTCAFDVCRPAACMVGVCDQAAKKCSAPAPYKEEAAQFTLPAPIACGNCVAAAYPYLFVGTTLGVLAYNVGNIALTNPATVPIIGLGFVPQTMVRSGNRLWMTGGPSGSGPASTLPVAYIDIPADPFATSITASTHLVSYDRPAEGYGVFGRDGESLLVYSLAATFPASVLTAPLTDPATLTATALAPGDMYSPVAVSGTRLLLASNATNVASFQLVNGAGSATPSNGAVVTIAAAPVVSQGPRAFAQAPDGTLFWSTSINNPPSGAPVPALTTTQKVTGFFLVASGTADISATVTGVDLEVFTNADVNTTVGANGAAAGPVAMLDSDTVLTTTAASEDVTTLTAINFVKRGAPPTLVAGKRVTIPASINSIAGASGSNGLGYVVANDPPAALGSPAVGHVYIFDSACTP